MGDPSFEIPPSATAPGRRQLDSWKEIAVYLNRDVTTVQRWEKREAMPVHRHLHALTSELDTWLQTRRVALEPEVEKAEPETPAPPTSVNLIQPSRRKTLWLVLASLAVVALAASAWLLHRAHSPGTAPPKIQSLAVLPFRNLSGDPEQEYLADGVTEALIGRLAGIHDLRVVSHTSVMRFRNPQMSVPEIAKLLNVDAVVEGSVVRENNRIHVTAQLIRAATDEHFWSETYDREMRDALTLQSELAQTIAEKVAVTLNGQEQQRLAAARLVAPEVYESYLKGRFELDRASDRAEMEKSVAWFDEAVRQDPTFAPAYLGLAQAWTTLGTVLVGRSPEETRPRAIRFARQALALDPNLVEAHVLLGSVLQKEWHWPEAEAEYRRALDLDPNDPTALAGYAAWLMCEGRSDEAVRWIQNARALDPVTVSGGDVAWVLFQTRHFDEAIRESRSATAANPEDVGSLMSLGFALIAANRAAEAVPIMEKAVALSHGGPAAIGVLIRAYAHSGRRSDALRVLEDLKRRRAAGYVPPAAFVNAYLGLGDTNQAFYWLDQACNEKSNILQFVKTHPYFDPVRNNPRFVALIHRVGLD
jgi:TolB-like protein/Flp pilus assembly protein TadD